MTDPAGPHGARLSRFLAALFCLALALVLALAVVWTMRGYAVFNYTEGVVLGSLAGFDASGLAGLYPPVWSSPPLVLTLYPPVFFWTTAAVDSVLGAADPLLAPRLVSLAATAGVGFALVRIRSLFGTGRTWFLVLVGAAALTPGIQRQLAAAQVDGLALAWTVAGAFILLRADKLGTRTWLAFVCFALAVFTKQSFVAAPAAALLHRFAVGHRREACFTAVGFAATVAAGFLLIDMWTAGGFSTHALAAVTDSGSPVNLARVMRDSAPTVWVPLVLLMFLGVRGRQRMGFPEVWASLAVLVHFAAMWKTGASVNYLLEPAVALIVLALARSADGPWGRDQARAARRLALGVLTVLVVASTVRGWRVAQGIAQAWGAVRISIAPYDQGYPLVEVDFFPAVFEHGGRPYVNDPFAFGALAESGTWDPSPLAADLEARRVPFALTTIDIEPALDEDATTEDLLFAYFWRMSAVRDGLRREYVVVSQGLLNVWVPGENGL